MMYQNDRVDDAVILVWTWNAVNNKLESQEGKVFPFDDFHEIFVDFFLRFNIINSNKIVVGCFETG